MCETHKKKTKQTKKQKQCLVEPMGRTGPMVWAPWAPWARGAATHAAQGAHWPTRPSSFSIPRTLKDEHN